MIISVSQSKRINGATDLLSTSFSFSFSFFFASSSLRIELPFQLHSAYPSPAASAWSAWPAWHKVPWLLLLFLLSSSSSFSSPSNSSFFLSSSSFQHRPSAKAGVMQTQVSFWIQLANDFLTSFFPLGRRDLTSFYWTRTIILDFSFSSSSSSSWQLVSAVANLPLSRKEERAKCVFFQWTLSIEMVHLTLKYWVGVCGFLFVCVFLILHPSCRFSRVTSWTFGYDHSFVHFFMPFNWTRRATDVTDYLSLCHTFYFSTTDS